MEVFEFEIHTSTAEALKTGVTALEIRKVLVVEVDWWAAYQTAVAMVWRGDIMVTSCQWVP